MKGKVLAVIIGYLLLTSTTTSNLSMINLPTQLNELSQAASQSLCLPEFPTQSICHAENPIINNSLTDAAMSAVNQNISMARLSELSKASKGKIDKIYLHWSAMPYNCAYTDYHINIGRFGEVIITCNSLDEKKAHTWHRNSRAIGISVDSMYGASYKKDGTHWGAYPVTPAQIKALAQVVAQLGWQLDIPIDKKHVMTHAECAIIDGYGLDSNDPEKRWDLLYLIDPRTGKEVPGGDLIREMANEVK